MSTPATRTPISRRALLGGAAALTVTVGGGAAWAADRFLIPHVEATVAPTASSGAASSSTQTISNATLTSDSYIRDGLELRITKHTSGSGTDALAWFVADVTVTDATTIQTAFANDQVGTNIIATTSAIASAHGMAFAINGDYYGFRDTGIVVRNGVAYRDKGARQGLALYTNGTMALYDETTTTAQALVDKGVWQTWSFGPGIVDAGSVVAGIDSVEIDTNVGNHSIQGNQPRTGVGVIAPNHFLFVVVDGRSSGYSRGMTMTEFANLFVSLGAQTAYNLDGGGSSEMWFNGQLVSNPLGKGQERGTSDIICIA